MATAAIRYDRSAILRDAWGRARKAAAEAAEGVRSFIGAAMRGAWASAKAALSAPALVPAAPVQIDLVDYIASLPPVAPAPRRFEMGPYTTVTKVGVDGEDEVNVFLTFVDGTVRTLGAVLIYSEDYEGPQAVLAEALRVIEEAREAVALPVVQQPDPEPEPESQAQAVPHLSARLAELAQERDEYRSEWLEYRRERIAIVNDELDGDAGIAWTNEERAEARYDDAVERYNEAYQDEWYRTSIAA